MPNDTPSRGGRRSRDKGNRVERAIVRALQDAGLGAERVPLSGSAGGSYTGDLTVPVLGRDLVVEVKAPPASRACTPGSTPATCWW